ncbi:transposase, partial [Ferrimicrobium sp.]|uniref:transposase n=1 Tax=Ferrimicrobium sp. TaxID=2926050 RepID=UPI0027E5B25F
ATETFTLATTLLDPEVAPSNELAELYQSRWEIESAFGAFKSQLKGDGVVLRSKTPDGAQQELWALLCAYHAIRELICAAAEMTKQDPLRISFIAALDTVRGPVGDPAAFPPHKTIDQCIGAALTLIAVHKIENVAEGQILATPSGLFVIRTDPQIRLDALSREDP